LFGAVALVLLALAAVSFSQRPIRAAPAAGATPTATGRTLHVSPNPLSRVPSGRQFRTIGEAARSVQPGDTVILHSGTYRETVVVEKSGTRERPIRFEAAPGANVVITGADRLLDWTKESGGEGENIYSAPWPHEFITWSETRTHPGDEYHRLIGRAEQVHVDDYPLLQVLRRDQLARGTFFADTAAKRLYVWTSNNAELPAASRSGCPASRRPCVQRCGNRRATTFICAASGSATPQTRRSRPPLSSRAGITWSKTACSSA
jgi:hypothetical protein